MSTLYACLLLPLALAAWCDLHRRRIPNALPAGIAALWLVAAVQGAAGTPLTGLATGAALLAIGMAVWRCGWLGGGDVKLVAVLGLWAGPANVDALLFGTALAGGALALLACFANRLIRSPLVLYVLVLASRLEPATIEGTVLPGWREQGLPYGVAVAAGGGWLVHRLLTA
jgi:prepilin peptidase CpaA